MNRRLFRIQSSLCGDSFPVVVIGKAESVAVAVQSIIIVGVASQSERFARHLFVERSYHCLRFPRCPLSALRLGGPRSFFFRPICADDAVHAGEHASHNHLFLLFSAPLRSAAPFGTTSPSCKRLPHRLCVAKSGERSAERYHNLKASADHRFSSCAAMQGFLPL